MRTHLLGAGLCLLVSSCFCLAVPALAQTFDKQGYVIPPDDSMTQIQNTAGYDKAQNNGGVSGQSGSGSSKTIGVTVFPPAGCSPRQPLMAWDGQGNTYCKAIPVCPPNQFLTSYSPGQLTCAAVIASVPTPPTPPGDGGGDTSASSGSDCPSPCNFLIFNGITGVQTVMTPDQFSALSPGDISAITGGGGPAVSITSVGGVAPGTYVVPGMTTPQNTGLPEMP